MTLPSTAAPAGLLCSCGRPAVLAYYTERFGLVGYCGVPGGRPLDPCDCAASVSTHDRAWCRGRSETTTSTHRRNPAPQPKERA